jgi:hypothetical protein
VALAPLKWRPERESIYGSRLDPRARLLLRSETQDRMPAELYGLYAKAH